MSDIQSDRDRVLRLLKSTTAPPTVRAGGDGTIQFLVLANGHEREERADAMSFTARAEPYRHREDYLLSVIADEEVYWLHASFVPALVEELAVARPEPWRAPIPPMLDELVRASDGRDVRLERRPVDDLYELVLRKRRIVILGAPGSGKSTTLRNLAIRLSVAAIRNESEPIPFFVPLRLQDPNSPPHAFLEERWRTNSWHEGPSLETLQSEGQVVLLLDGLNEIDASGSDSSTARWGAFLAASDERLIVVTCRSRDYDVPTRLHQVEIAEFDENRQLALARNLLGPSASEFIASTAASKAQNLLRNPFSLSILAWLYAEQSQVGDEDRERLYDNFVSLFVSRAFQSWPQKGIDLARSSLEALAFQMLLAGTTSVSITDRNRDTVTLGGTTRFDASLLDAALSARLLIRTGDYVRFAHHLFQETLAGRQLAREWNADAKVLISKVPILQPELEDDLVLALWERLPPPPSTGWNTSLSFAIHLASDANELIREVCTKNPLLAASSVPDNFKLDQTTRTHVTGALLKMLDSSTSIRVRVQAGDLLSDIGDPRFASTDRNSSGPFVAIPDRTSSTKAAMLGKYAVTVSQYAQFVDAGCYNKREHWTTDGRYWLEHGLSDVGVVEGMLRQRLLLLRSERSLLAWQRHYGWSPETLSFWTRMTNISEDEAAVALSERFRRRMPASPAYWMDQEYSRPNYPVVGITLFEAQAYASWRSSLTGQPHVVQSRASWLVASRGAKDARYPWGDEGLPGAANTVESHVLRPVAVGSFPRDQGRYRAFDFVGNVREWTRTIDPGKSGGAPEYFVLGGAWSRSLEVASRDATDSFFPDFWDYNLGFRVSIESS